MCSSSVLQLSNKSQVCSKYLWRWYLDLGPTSLFTEVWVLLMFNGRDSKEDKEVQVIYDIAIVFGHTVTWPVIRFPFLAFNKLFWGSIIIYCYGRLMLATMFLKI